MFPSDGRATQLYDEATIAAFHQQASCLATQYSGYSIAEARVDGNLTLGENLADHGGLRMALAAYSRWRSNHIDYRSHHVLYSSERSRLFLKLNCNCYGHIFSW